MVVHGQIAQSGEVDDYSFRAPAGARLRFEVFSSPTLDPAYQRAASWFDPGHIRRLAFNDEPVSYTDLSTEPALRHRFETAGEYYVRVSSFLGNASPDHSYFLRIVPDVGEAAEAGLSQEGPVSSRDWVERSWTRPLRTDRMQALWSRAVPSLALQAALQPPQEVDSARIGNPDPLAAIPIVDLSMSEGAQSTPLRISLPTLLVGTIRRPGQIHRVRFSASAGDRIALEIETPEKTIPLFNPYLRVADSGDVEVVTNVHSFINSNNDVEKQIHPKTIHTFPRAGEFTLEIRDITANWGDSGMAYRVLIRPQVPHMGTIHIQEDALNVEAGRAAKLSIITDQEEGFGGCITLQMEGLPPGVEAVTATEAEPDQPPPINRGREDQYIARSRKATFVLMAAADAPATLQPATVRISARPIMEGQPGPVIPVKDLLVMVLPKKQKSGSNLDGSR